MVRRGQWSFDPKGALSPKFAQNRGPLKIASKLHDFEEILVARGFGPPGSLDPLLIHSASGSQEYTIRVLALLYSRYVSVGFRDGQAVFILVTCLRGV